MVIKTASQRCVTRRSCFETGRLSAVPWIRLGYTLNCVGKGFILLTRSEDGAVGTSFPAVGLGRG